MAKSAGAQRAACRSRFGVQILAQIPLQTLGGATSSALRTLPSCQAERDMRYDDRLGFIRVLEDLYTLSACDQGSIIVMTRSPRYGLTA